MLVRIADSLFWMARYLERADGLTRLIKINYSALLDFHNPEKFNWSSVLKLASNLEPHSIDELKFKNFPCLNYLIIDKTNINSIYNIITNARNNARINHNHITIELWKCINETYLFLSSDKPGKMIKSNQILVLTDTVNKLLTQYYGTLYLTISRSNEWNFIQLGIFTERALHIIEFIDEKFKEINYDLKVEEDIVFWKYFLLTISGYEYYLKNSPGDLSTLEVTNMVLLNKIFPFSITFCLREIHHNILSIKNNQFDPNFDEIEFELGRILNTLYYTKINCFTKNDFKPYLQNLRNDILNLINLIQKYYFQYL